MPKSLLPNSGILVAAAAWPFASFYTHNINQGISTHHLWLLYLIFTATLLFAYFTLTYFFKNTRKILNIFVFLSIFFSLFSVIEHFVVAVGITPHYLILFSIWLLIGVAASWILWRVSRDNQSTKPILVILFSLYIVPLGQLSAYFLGSPNANVVSDHQAQKPLKGGMLKHEPNVYFIVVDGYARSDVLTQQLNYDNSWFTKKLEHDGFFVAKKSMSNYPMTTYSLSSTLEMQYLLNENNKEGLHSHSLFHRYISGDNAVVRFFKERAYSFVYFESHKWTGFRCAEDIADYCLYPSYENFLLTNETVTNILQLTPIYRPLARLAPLIERDSKRTHHDIEVLDDYLSKTLSSRKQPLFLYAHFISPHPPNTYGSDCSIATPELALKDWSDVRGYTSQVECVSHDLLKLISTINALDSTSPVIIIQSDHGSSTRDQFDKPLDQWDREDIVERFGILNAMKIRNECNGHLYDTISSVNTFRVVLACLMDTKPDLLPDLSFFTNYENYPDDDLVRVISKDGNLW